MKRCGAQKRNPVVGVRAFHEWIDSMGWVRGTGNPVFRTEDQVEAMPKILLWGRWSR